ncbi:hypothetical protein IWT25_02339 [Secundilactobacillus pentosiphilus]|uniref:Surface layer protein A domain-containing protein n=1 Tax=Secundilactobacillus pentosiphilus TaxID=1714682 RepID=A0A1Z5IZT9_9LACO|nr:hypothetical protein [Secundilactobacillus pentosiphilus]GAX06991.1 hypothetical protein IWT25_02339 [Secundilactobacillus pentosiphilus]
MKKRTLITIGLTMLLSFSTATTASAMAKYGSHYWYNYRHVYVKKTTTAYKMKMTNPLYKSYAVSHKTLHSGTHIYVKSNQLHYAWYVKGSGMTNTSKYFWVTNRGNTSWITTKKATSKSKTSSKIQQLSPKKLGFKVAASKSFSTSKYETGYTQNSHLQLTTEPTQTDSVGSYTIKSQGTKILAKKVNQKFLAIEVNGQFKGYTYAGSVTPYNAYQNPMYWSNNGHTIDSLTVPGKNTILAPGSKIYTDTKWRNLGKGYGGKQWHFRYKDGKFRSID